MPYLSITQQVAVAVQIERERCAKIARSFIEWPASGKAGIVVATAIADAIENDAEQAGKAARDNG